MSPLADAINASFEVLAGVFVLMHCHRLYRDKAVRGASWVATAFFFAWALWNLYYYARLDQWLSYVGGIGAALANGIWLGLMLYYRKK